MDRRRLRGARHRPGERHGHVDDGRRRRCLPGRRAPRHASGVGAEDRLVAHEVGEWMELPLWIAPGTDEAAALNDVRTERAVATGLTVRPLADTVQATLELATPVDGVGLAPERERAVLADAG